VRETARLTHLGSGLCIAAFETMLIFECIYTTKTQTRHSGALPQMTALPKSFNVKTEGSIRTFSFIRWPGHIAPNNGSYAMFSEMDFLPSFAAILGAKLPTDRPIDGVDQTAVLYGKSETGARESLLTFIGPDLNLGGIHLWTVEFAYKAVRDYEESLKKYPNPPAPNLTRFTGH
jgi:arylsulfatase A-like enzyme